MIYEHDIDEAIINELEYNKKACFCTLLDISIKVNPKTTPRTLSKHLNAMSQQDIIIRDPFKPGVERYCCLHPDAKLQRELGIFEGVKSKREKKALRKKETEEEKTKKAIRLLLSQAAFDGQIPKVAEKIKPGNLIVYNQSKGKKEEIYFEAIPGVSVSDISQHRTTTYFGTFSQLLIKSSELESDIKILTKHDVLIPIDESNGETRYGISRGNKLQEFIKDCENTLADVIVRMEAAWRYRRPNIKKGEAEWYKWIYGQSETTRFFDEARKKRSNTNKDPRKNKIKQSKREVIKKYDDDIRYRIKKLDSNYYSEIEERYHVFYKVMREETYPSFLRDLLADHKI